MTPPGADDFDTAYDRNFHHGIYMTNIALIGCAHIHTPGFVKKIKDHGDVTIKTVWDHDAARGQKFADDSQARFMGDLAPILADPEISAVVICSETDRHHDLVLPAAEAKKDLFAEKPLGFAAADGYAMAEAIEKAGVKFQTGYFQRGNPVHIYLKDQIAKGLFGKITRVRGSNCHAGALGGWFDKDYRWMADPKIAGCGAFGDLGTHSLDILIWLMGDVSSATGALAMGTARYPDCEETGEAVMKFKSGVIGTLGAAWDDVANPVTLIISGTDAHATVIYGQLFITSKQLNSDGKSPWADLPPAKPAGFDAFLDAITGKDATLVSPREAAYRSAVMEAIYEGARHNNWETPKVG
jgi:predicted dehydrogenase